MGNIIFIGLYGPSGVGKDTTAERLRPHLWKVAQGAHHPFSCAIMSLADPLYERLAILTGLSVRELHDRAVKELVFTEEDAPFPALVGHSIRTLLQVDGSEHGRDLICPDLWADHLLWRAKRRFGDQDGVVLVPDVRYSNEAERMDFVVELIRDGVDHQEWRHRSDRRLPDFLVNAVVQLASEPSTHQYMHLAQVIRSGCDTSPSWWGAGDG